MSRPNIARDPGYQATVADIKDWERRHGPIPAGSVVMIRSDWSKKMQSTQSVSRHSLSLA